MRGIHTGAAAAVEAFVAELSLVVVAVVSDCDGEANRIEEKFFDCDVEHVRSCEAGCGLAEPMDEDSQAGRGLVAAVGNTGAAACCEGAGADQVAEEFEHGYCPVARALDLKAVKAFAAEQTFVVRVESENFVLQEAQGSDCNFDESLGKELAAAEAGGEGS